MLLNKLPDILKERGLKQKFICIKTGLSTTRMSAIVHGAIPELENALKIAMVLGLKVEDIWSLEEEGEIHEITQIPHL